MAEIAESKLSVEAREHHHEVTLNWTIRNFKQRYDTAKASERNIAEEKFTIGDERWMFSIEQEGEEDMGIFLYFLGTDCFSAEYSVYLKSSTGEFIKDLDMELHKYAAWNANIEGATNSWGRRKWTFSGLQNEGFLQNDQLQMKINVDVYSLDSKAQLKSDLSTDFKNGLNSLVGSDITFVFMEEGSEEVVETIETHKAILSLRSPVFAKMFGSGMKEATEGEVKITDMTPKAMRFLLNFIYSGSVGEDWQSAAEELLYGADKYDLPKLQTFLCENISSALTLENVWRIRKLASLYKLPQVLKSTMKFLKENAEVFLDSVEDVIFKQD